MEITQTPDALNELSKFISVDLRFEVANKTVMIKF